MQRYVTLFNSSIVIMKHKFIKSLWYGTSLNFYLPFSNMSYEVIKLFPYMYCR